jgi:hypothetical protein
MFYIFKDTNKKLGYKHLINDRIENYPFSVMGKDTGFVRDKG